MSAKDGIRGSGEGSDVIIKRLEGLLQELMETKNVHHAIVAVESGDGSCKWIGAAGKANPDGTPMKAETPFWIASVTKLYIAAVILKLQEQGRISINDTLVTYLPRKLIDGLHRFKGVDYTNKITLRHLLSHSSGLPDYLEIHPQGEKSLYARIVEDGDQSFNLEDVAELLRRGGTSHFPPQPLGARKKRVRYSDTNFQFLIAVIEAVMGKPLSAAFEEILYKPLDLKQTFHPGTTPAQDLPPVATVWYQDKPLDLPKAMASFGDLNSTAEDLLTFMGALMRGKVFDDPATFDLMTRDWNQFGFSLSPIGPGWPIEYGLGLMRFHIPRIFSPFRPIPEVIGHSGACGSWLFYSPELDVFLAGSVSQITASGVPFRFVPKLLSAIGPLFQ